MKWSALVASFGLALPALGASDAWQQTIDEVSSGVVSVRIERVRAFDTTWYANSQATGFVVDLEQGLILTNRHVVSPGPVVAEAMFLDGEEVPLEAVYRDPVHDFGFFRFDPSALRHIEPAELSLHPEGAEVGVDIRVIGNDAGEKLSILSGTLARLDRPAPSYGRGKYNDFNTFYIQAASSTSGGSSGSPVIDEQGRVVALNAGSNTRAAASFYLPLDRVVRALDLVRQGKPIPRGTLETTFAHKPFDELRRLGLSEAAEAAVRARAPEAIGMLVVGSVLPEGTAHEVLREGDIVLAVDGTPVDGFVPLEAHLDDHVGETVKVSVERGGEPLELDVTVQDLHAITPDAFVEIGRGVLHDLSYQKARTHHLPRRGVYVADNGYLLDRDGVPYQGIITELDGRPVEGLDALQDILVGLPDGHRARVRYYLMQEPQRERVTTLKIDRRWFPVRRCEEAVGPWDCEDLPAPSEAVTPTPASTTLQKAPDARARKVLPSLVNVRFDVPYTIDGTRGANYSGPGLILDAERGLVVADRNTVPITLGDVGLVFANDLEVPAEVVMVHPFHDVSLLRYDPALVGDTPVASATWTDTVPEAGDALWWVGRRRDGRVVSKSARVESVDPVAIGLPSRPRFRETNLDVIRVDGAPGGGAGVLVDKRGQVAALWGSLSFDGRNGAAEYNAGLPSWLFDELLAAHDDPEGPTFRDLEVELGFRGLLEARDMGLDEAWIRRLAAHDDTRRALTVVRATWGSPAGEVLRGGDLLLAVDGLPVTSFREVEMAVASAETVTLTVFRDGAVSEIPVTPRTMPGDGVERVVMWAGAFLQATPLPAQRQRMTPTNGVYVDLRWRGGPSMRYGLDRNSRILEVDGRPTPDLDAFLAAVSGKADRDPVRLTTVDLDGRREVVTLKLDLTYWPTRELLRTDEGWMRRELP